jgi:probable HAF family extracellular repeat protein
MRKINCCFFVALLSAFAFIPTFVRATTAAIYSLGTLGGTASFGRGINVGGQVAGYSITYGNTANHAFRYSGIPGSGGTMIDLGSLGGTFSSSYGFGINASGQVVGETQTALGGGSHAFLYTGTPGSGSVMADLGSLGGTRTVAVSVSNGGQVVGWGYFAGDTASHGFTYIGVPRNGGQMFDLGTLGGTNTTGLGVNDNGQIVGASQLPDSSMHAFLYEGTPGNGGTMSDLGTLGGRNSWGWAINASGQVAGHSYITGDVSTHAFMHIPGSGGMSDLGTLGGSSSEGYSINASGQVAGYSLIAGDAARHAFLYTGTPGAGGHMIDLDAWLHANNPTQGSKWTLLEADGLSDTGLITGFGFYNDGGTVHQHAFILDASALLVPEPASIVLMGIWVVGVLWWRRSRWCASGAKSVLVLRTSNSDWPI